VELRELTDRHFLEGAKPFRIAAFEQLARVLAAEAPNHGGKRITFCVIRQPVRTRRYTASKIPAAPMPVPMHIVTMPYFCLRRRRPCSRVATRMAPVAPSGWPSAIAPP